MRHIRKLIFSLCMLMIQSVAFTQKTITVAQDGTGDFTTIQSAVNSIPADNKVPQLIFIKNGVYREKIYIEKNFIGLIGESRVQTVIEIDQARDIWRCDHESDWGVATVNLKGNNITLSNMTIKNSWGFNYPTLGFDSCKNDSNKVRTIRQDGHQMALRSFSTTKLIVKNCNLVAFGGDTVSPWNVEDGMFYFYNCTMEGGVDFYCPRGWSYAVNCTFIAHSGSASIWHDGSKYKDSKTVLKDCKFQGFDGFNLGRYHKDAQFYLLNCEFAANMADKDIYLVPTNNEIKWGRRIYYYNCHRKAGNDFKWYADNLQTAEGKVSIAGVDAKWVFGGKWDPE